MSIYNNYKQYGIMLAVGFNRLQLFKITIVKNLFILTMAFIIGATITYLILPLIGDIVLFSSGLL